MSVHDIQSHFKKTVQAMEQTSELLAAEIDRCCSLIVDALKNGKKILIMGNGGSAGDAQHFAAELVGRFLMERRALPAIALTTDTSILTAVGNDYGFGEVFSRQVEALAGPGDVVIGISTSGNSGNVLKALESARAAEAITVGLLGREGGAIAEVVDLDLTVRVNETPAIQEVHSTIIHIICDQVEKRLFGQP